MWNNLKSDMYRILHARYLYIIIAMTILTTCLILNGEIMQCNSLFATFNPHENTFAEFLFYILKSMMPVLLSLILIVMFSTDEYNSGFIKNVYPLQTHKWKYVVERYIFSMILITCIFLISIATACVMQVFQNIAFGTMDIGSYVIYFIVQIFILSAVASFINMMIHAVKSRVLAILIAIGFSAMFIYMLFIGLSNFIFHDVAILDYTLYALSGKLPYMFSIEGYQTAILVTVGNLVLYNGISTALLYKKDIK